MFTQKKTVGCKAFSKEVSIDLLYLEGQLCRVLKYELVPNDFDNLQAFLLLQLLPFSNLLWLLFVVILNMLL